MKQGSENLKISSAILTDLSLLESDGMVSIHTRDTIACNTVGTSERDCVQRMNWS
jgi:hypothetical protein